MPSRQPTRTAAPAGLEGQHATSSSTNLETTFRFNREDYLETNSVAFDGDECLLWYCIASIFRVIGSHSCCRGNITVESYRPEDGSDVFRNAGSNFV
jgi:hypothetical protein